MAFQLPNSPRGPAPKGIKIKNTDRLALYRRNNPHCELCRLELNIIPATEVHHIWSRGRGGSDLDWNIIHLCHRHHVECTEHVKGEEADKNNLICLALKQAKGELSERTLKTLENTFKLLDKKSFAAISYRVSVLFDLANKRL